MTLEIEYEEGSTHVLSPLSFDFLNGSKTGLLHLPKPFKDLECSDVERRVTDHGTVYSGTVVGVKDPKAKFFLYL